MTDAVTIFDRFFDDLLSTPCVGATTDTSTYPPTDIVKVGDDKYMVILAVAGFAAEELKVSVQNNTLTIDGQHSARSVDPESPPEVYLYKGIAKRKFRKQFTLRKNVSVSYASLNDGLLVVQADVVAPETSAAIDIPIY